MKQAEKVVYSSIQAMQKQLNYKNQAKHTKQKREQLQQKTNIMSLDNDKLENFQQQIENLSSQFFRINSQLKDNVQKSTIQLLQSQDVDHQINNRQDYQMANIQIPDLSQMSSYLNHFNQYELVQILFVQEKMSQQRQKFNMVKDRYLEKLKKMNQQVQKLKKENKNSTFCRYK